MLWLKKIKNAIEQKGYSFQFTPCSNQKLFQYYLILFCKIRKEFLFTDWEKIDNNHTSVRIVTSWATKGENVQKLIKNKLDKHKSFNVIQKMFYFSV